MSKLYSIRQSVAVATLCLLSEFSYGLVSCQNGLDYKNSCNPYNISFTKVSKTEAVDSNDRVALKQVKKEKKVIRHQPKSYFESLLNKYRDNYNANSGLQALIDRSSYSTLKLKDIDSNKSLVKSKPKPSKVTKVAIKTDKHLEKSSKDKKKIVKVTTKTHTKTSKLDTNRSKIAKTIVKKSKIAKKEKKESLKIAKVEKKKISIEKKSINKKVIAKKDLKKVLKSKKITKKVIVKNSNKEKYKIYTIQKGDNLSKIASRYSIKKSTLLKLNTLDKNRTIKVGQKLKIPAKAKLAKVTKKKVDIKKKINKNSSVYIVQSGDTLSKIAQKTRLSITKLREINRLSRSSRIAVGQKLYLKGQKAKKRENRTFNFAKNIKFKKAPSLKHKRKIRVTATAYTSHRRQTDSTPFLAAWNNRLRPGMKIIAVSPDLIKKYGLTNGVKVKIMGLSGYYVVRDKMNKRWRNRIDIYMGTNKRRALNWGRRRIVLYW